MAVVNLNLSLEQILEFIENLPQEYKKAAFDKLEKENKSKEEILSKELLLRVSEMNINLLEVANSKEEIENNFKNLVLFYEQIGNEYEQLIHTTTEVKKAVRIKKYLENIISTANFYLNKIKKQFDKEQHFLESLTNEIENIEELNQDIQLKFFDIPSNTSIHEILKRI